MKVLIVKTSSLGDVIHTWPALTDAAAAIPGIRFDWLVEEGFAALPGWHPAVDETIPVALRRWLKQGKKGKRKEEFRALRQQLGSRRYDLIIDAQGLYKSAVLAWMAQGPRAGLDRHSAREGLAAWSYNRSYRVARDQHAITRLRQLFAQALGYDMPTTPVDYGVRVAGRPADSERPYLVFLHATTWSSKHWPQLYWGRLLLQAVDQGYEVLFPWHAPEERLAAERIIKAAGCGKLAPRQGLAEMAATLAGAAGVVGVDTGLAHLAAAVGAPGVTLYGPTSQELTGALGPRQKNQDVNFDCAPCRKRECGYVGDREVEPACFATLKPERVWDALQSLMSG